MRAKSFVFKILGIFIVSYMMLFSFYYIVDPQQEFSSNTKKKYFHYTKQYSIKQFNQLKKDCFVLVFGTSQINMISSEMMKKNTLNLYNLYGEPGDILNFLKQLNNKQINNISQIIYLVDLSANAYKIDINLIDYSETFNIDFSLNVNDLKTLFYDIRYRILQDYDYYLQEDGSRYHLEPTKYIKLVSKHYGDKLILKYTDKLISDILEIDSFSKKNKIKITYITPVLNEESFNIISFDELYDFYSILIDKGVENLNLYYFIDGYSNKNAKGEYIAFMDSVHLNKKYVEKWLNEYILKKTEFTINNKQELRNYIVLMKSKQSK